MTERVLPTMSVMTIMTPIRGVFIATSLASQLSSAQRPIVAWAYSDRPQLAKAIAALGEGDTLSCLRIDPHAASRVRADYRRYALPNCGKREVSTDQRKSETITDQASPQKSQRSGGPEAPTMMRQCDVFTSRI